MKHRTLNLRIRLASLALLVGAGVAVSSAAQAEEEKGTVNLAYVVWASEVASTNEVQAFRLKETVNMIETSKGWKIDRIERTHYEPYNFRTAMQ
jgi:ABC-type proline/glycine betaine transport system substrate-binding protein